LYAFQLQSLIVDDPEYFRGAPVNLQVVGRPWEDEKVLAAMELIERVVVA
jgi:Asp-tRNA(Asn)/Glu-tRNA(Gln) amidotransferase A subunit family amidase